MSASRPFYKKRSVQVVAVIVAVPVLAIAWWLGSPLLFDTEVNEAFPRAAAAEIPDDMTAEEVEAEVVTASENMPEAAEGSDGSEPVALASGALMGADSFHQGSGDATVYQLEDGSPRSPPRRHRRHQRTRVARDHHSRNRG